MNKSDAISIDNMDGVLNPKNNSKQSFFFYGISGLLVGLILLTSVVFLLRKNKIKKDPFDFDMKSSGLGSQSTEVYNTPKTESKIKNFKFLLTAAIIVAASLSVMIILTALHGSNSVSDDITNKTGTSDPQNVSNPINGESIEDGSNMKNESADKNTIKGSKEESINDNVKSLEKDTSNPTPEISETDPGYNIKNPSYPPSNTPYPSNNNPCQPTNFPTLPSNNPCQPTNFPTLPGNAPYPPLNTSFPPYDYYPSPQNPTYHPVASFPPSNSGIPPNNATFPNDNSNPPSHIPRKPSLTPVVPKDPPTEKDIVPDTSNKPQEPGEDTEVRSETPETRSDEGEDPTVNQEPAEKKGGENEIARADPRLKVDYEEPSENAESIQLFYRKEDGNFGFVKKNIEPIYVKLDVKDSSAEVLFDNPNDNTGFINLKNWDFSRFTLFEGNEDVRYDEVPEFFNPNFYRLERVFERETTLSLFYGGYYDNKYVNAYIEFNRLPTWDANFGYKNPNNDWEWI